MRQSIFNSIRSVAAVWFFILCGCAAETPIPGREPHRANPILPGYYADPSLVQVDGKIFIYATLDPWGDQTLGCWESSDFKQWTYRVLNWPTKNACTSPTSVKVGVWAPSVVRGKDGRFYMYVSVGSEVWVGVADHALGPWKNAVGDKPFIPGNYRPGFHMIDAECFVDDDGSAYLYWGSGWGWKNGKCWAVKLKPDMVTFDSEVQDVTPRNYFEGRFMVKRHGLYFLMYSQGKTVTDTYQVHYAVGSTPFGPFTEGPTSPILVTDKANNVISPGHHAVFARDGRDYILYHRHSIPFDPKFIGRQVCIDPIIFTSDGRIDIVKPTHAGPELVQGRYRRFVNLAVSATASASADAHTAPVYVLDDNYATRWVAPKDAKGIWLQLDLGEVKAFDHQELLPEYAWKKYHFSGVSSVDGVNWTTLVDYTKDGIGGSPLIIDQTATARYLRVIIPDETKGPTLSLFEWSVGHVDNKP